MYNEIIFKKGDLVLPDITDEEAPATNGGYLPLQKTSSDIFNKGPLPVALTIDVECTCGAKNGDHSRECPRAKNFGHSQILILTCPDKSQIQCTGTRKKIVAPQTH